MKFRKNKKPYPLFIKLVLLITILVIVAVSIMWLFYRSTARNIGFYLNSPRKDSAALLIGDYIGDPPSKLKALFLSKMYNITIEYYENEQLRWQVGNELSLPQK